MALGTALALGAAVGGAAGAFGSESTQSKRLVNPSDLEKFSGSLSADQLKQLQGLVGAGPGASDVAAGVGAQRDLAAMLGKYSQTGGLPEQQDIQAANRFGQSIFKPQQVAQEQAFADQLVQANRQAAAMGRDINDPILRAKLAQEQTRQNAMLQAQMGAFNTQFSLQQPLQRLGFAQQRTDVLAGLGQQALANRTNLFQLGQQALSQEQNFRLGSADVVQKSGGGIGGFLTGALGGAGAGASIASAFNQQAFNNNFLKQQQQGMPQQAALQSRLLASPPNMGPQPVYNYSGVGYGPLAGPTAVAPGSGVDYSGSGGWGPLAPRQSSVNYTYGGLYSPQSASNPFRR